MKYRVLGELIKKKQQGDYNRGRNAIEKKEPNQYFF